MEQTDSVISLTEILNSVSEYDSYKDYVIEDVIKPLIPKFLYFDEYYQIRGCENIETLMSLLQNLR